MKTPSFISSILSVFFVLLAFESTGYAKDKLAVTGSELPFQLGNVKDITVLAHSVCSFQSLTENEPDNYIFVEGDICPIGGGKCDYYALMNINGKDIKLRRIGSSQKSTDVKFMVGDINIRVKYIPTKCFSKNNRCESTLQSAILNISQGKIEKKIKVKGECGD